MVYKPQLEAVETLRRFLCDDARVRGMVVVGSLAYAEAVADQWSDVDLLVVVAEEDFAHFHPAIGWLGRRGVVYASEASQHGPFGIARAYFTDGLRVDVIVAPESACGEGDRWPLTSLQYGARCLFSRSAALDGLLAYAASAEAAPAREAHSLEAMSNAFRFKGMLAAGKVARGDLLVALHLTLDLVRECAALAMMLRDRRLGADHHRGGDPEDPLLPDLPAAPASHSSTAILDCIVGSAEAFSRLAARLMEGYEFESGPLLASVGRARAGLR